MAVLLIHDRPEVLTALHGALAASGCECLSALGEDNARLILSADMENEPRRVGAIIASVELASLALDFRSVAGGLPVALLAEENPEAWGQRLPGEWVLPVEPLPVAALVGWLTGEPAPEDASPTLARPETGPEAFAPLSPHTVPVPAAGMSTPRLGDYDLLEVLHETEKTVVYRAWQHSVQRVVVLERLKSAFLSDPEEVATFRALVRAKAAAVHPQIAAVYEAQEQEGLIFYTRELLEAWSVSELPRAGRRLNEETVLALLGASADVVNYLDQAGLAREALTPDEVMLAADGLPRVANLAVGGEPVAHPERREISTLIQATLSLLSSTDAAPVVQVLAARVRDKNARRGLPTWQAFGAAVAEARQRLAPTSPVRRRAGSRRTSSASGRRWLMAGALVLAGIGVYVLQRWPYWQAPAARVLDDMVRIPGGEFIYQQGETRTLPAFWIDKYEVSLAHYEEFLSVARAHPEAVASHPEQPKSKTSHEPAGWNERLDAAKRGGLYRGLKQDVNAPVTGVDFWDAWSYAQWKGRRLPTEVEWEKAARGAQGFQYPWGNALAPAKANTGTDYEAKDGRGKVDGFAGPAPVDAFAATDVSPFGVTNMAGNVAEWTASTTLHPELIDQVVPLVRGGAFDAKPATLLHRRPATGYGHTELSLGFRTAADRAP